MEPDPIELIARAAHSLWRTQKKREGWSYGPRHDLSAKKHDALRPFARLSRSDRDQLRLAIESEGIEKQLVRLVDFPRGPSRPFTRHEMRKGRAVQLVDRPDVTGSIESWAANNRGILETIRVRWPDGSIVAYAAQERALTRPEEL